MVLSCPFVVVKPWKTTVFLAQSHTETFPKPNPFCAGTSLLSLFLMCVHLCKCVCMFKCVHLCM